MRHFSRQVPLALAALLVAASPSSGEELRVGLEGSFLSMSQADPVLTRVFARNPSGGMGRLALRYRGSVAAIGVSVGFSTFQLKRGFVSDRFRSFEIDRPARVNVVPFELEGRLCPWPGSRLRPIVLAGAGRAWTQIDYPVDQWARWIWRGTARLAGGVEVGRDRVGASLLGGWQYLGEFRFPQHHLHHDISGWSISLGVTMRVAAWE